MENISRFGQAARAYGLSDAETFQTVDLYERMNLHQVILCLFALGRKVNPFPFLCQTLINSLFIP